MVSAGEVGSSFDSAGASLPRYTEAKDVSADHALRTVLQAMGTLSFPHGKRFQAALASFILDNFKRSNFFIVSSGQIFFFKVLLRDISSL